MCACPQTLEPVSDSFSLCKELISTVTIILFSGFSSLTDVIRFGVATTLSQWYLGVPPEKIDQTLLVAFMFITSTSILYLIILGGLTLYCSCRRKKAYDWDITVKKPSTISQMKTKLGLSSRARVSLPDLPRALDPLPPTPPGAGQGGTGGGQPDNQTLRPKDTQAPPYQDQTSAPGAKDRYISPWSGYTPCRGGSEAGDDLLNYETPIGIGKKEQVSDQTPASVPGVTEVMPRPDPPKLPSPDTVLMNPQTCQVTFTSGLNNENFSEENLYDTAD